MSATRTLPKKNWWDVGGLSGQTTDTLGGLGSSINNLGAGQPGGESAPGPWSDNTPVQGGQSWTKLNGPLPGDPGPLYVQPDGSYGHTPPAGQGGSTAQAGGNAFGTTYTDPGGGWNPWSLYDGRNGYDGTAVDGHYNAAADTKKGWGPNGTPESDRDRVWRMTLDTAKAQGWDAGSPQNADRLKAAFLNNVARLKRDYMNTPGMGAQAWANSAFSGYDKFAQGGQGGQGGAATTSGPAPGRGDQPQGSVVINGGGQYGASGSGGPIDPATYAALVNARDHGFAPGQGPDLPKYPGAAATAAQAQQNGGPAVTPNDPTNPYNTPTGATGGNPPGGGTPLPTVPPTGQGGAAGQGAPMGGYYYSDPTSAVTPFLAQHNVQIGDHNPWAEFLRNLATGIAKPIASTLPTGANGQLPLDRLNNLPQMLTDLIYGNGGQAFGNIAAYGKQVQSEWTPDKLATMKAPDVESLLASIRGFQTLGQNPYQQSFQQQALSDLFARYQEAVRSAPGAGVHAPNPNWLLDPANDPFHIFGH